MKKFNILMSIVFMMMSFLLSSCAVIEGIFKTGLGVGIFITVVVVVIIGGIAAMMRGGSK